MKPQLADRHCAHGIPCLFAAAWPALLLASLILLPWLEKAHTIDDTTFLLMAEHVLKDPLHPTAFDMVADGSRIRLSSQLVSGPLMAYLLVPSVLLGGAEWAAHLIQFLLMLAAILATVSLGFRLGLDSGKARLAGIILASTPAVMVMATTSMADVPAMAFAVLGMERFVAWIKDRRQNQGATAAIFFALAALARPQLVLIFLVAGGFVLFPSSADDPYRFRDMIPLWPRLIPASVIEKREHKQNSFMSLCVIFLPLFISLLLTILVAIGTSDPARMEGHFLGATRARFEGTNIAANLVSFSLHWVLVFPLAVLWTGFRFHWKRLALGLPLILILAAILYYWSGRWTLVFALLLALAGACVLLDILIHALRWKDSIQLVLAAWILIPLPAIGYVHFPSKYLVCSAPAVALLLARVASEGGTRLRVTRWVAVSAGVVLSLLIIAADSEFAAFGREFSARQIAPMRAKNEKVWINSGWGFQWYASKAGALPVSEQPPLPSSGQILVSSSAAPHISLDRFPHRQLLSAFSKQSRFGRIMTRPAGFYSNGYGFYPWMPRNGHLETITVWRIDGK